jgi:hypothetical protein
LSIPYQPLRQQKQQQQRNQSTNNNNNNKKNDHRQQTLGSNSSSGSTTGSTITINSSNQNSNHSNNNNEYPTTTELLEIYTDPRIIIHRLPDNGPLTRYLGPLAYEQHPDTAIVTFDMDSGGIVPTTATNTATNNAINPNRDLIHLLFASHHIDPDAMWCHQGGNFEMNKFNQVRPSWDIFPSERYYNKKKNNYHDHEFANPHAYSYTWNHVHLCRAVAGLLFTPKHFSNFWYNQTSYHESCFWDDDRWMSYQVTRQGFPINVVHATRTTTKTITTPSQQQRR